jgi:hypothetical protein
MPPEISYGNLTIPSDIAEFYRNFYRYFSTVSSSYSADHFFNFIDYPTTFRFEITKKKIKTLDIE